MVGDKVRDHLINHHALSPQTALQIALGARERATIDLVDQAGRAPDAKGFVRHLNAAGRLSASLLMRALANGHMTFFEWGMAELAGVPHHRTWLMIHDAGPLGLKAIYERAGLPARLFPAFRAGVDTFHAMEAEGGATDAEVFQERMLQRFLTQPRMATARGHGLPAGQARPGEERGRRARRAAPASLDLAAKLSTLAPEEAKPSLRRNSMPSEPAPIRPAATILLVRDDPAFQVLMVKRHHQIDFASGALVFPGGKTHEGDHDPAWSAHATGWEAAPEDQRALRIAAIREVYEEAGVLLAARRGRRRVPRRRARGSRAGGRGQGRARLHRPGRRTGPKLDLERPDRVRPLDHPGADAQAVRHLVLPGPGRQRAAGGLRRLGDGGRRMDRAGRGAWRWRRTASAR